jgi:hypothetical protein
METIVTMDVLLDWDHKIRYWLPIGQPGSLRVWTRLHLRYAECERGKWQPPDQTAADCLISLHLICSFSSSHSQSGNGKARTQYGNAIVHFIVHGLDLRGSSRVPTQFKRPSSSSLIYLLYRFGQLAKQCVLYLMNSRMLKGNCGGLVHDISRDYLASECVVA